MSQLAGLRPAEGQRRSWLVGQATIQALGIAQANQGTAVNLGMSFCLGQPVFEG